MIPYHENKNSPLLEFRNVTIIIREKIILDNISSTINEGEHIAILGPNGAGKSTFIRTINREYYPAVLDGYTSVFRMHGREIWNVWDLRAHLGIVSNDLLFSFNREITGREVILSGFFSSVGLFNHHVTAAMQDTADHILDFLEIDHLQQRPMTSLSSGEARRFLIGRALVHDPKTLILDEPTNSLDLHSLHTFRSLLRKIAQSGTGIILVTHNLHDIIPEIRRVILMKEGRFWKDGQKTDLLTDETLTELFRVPLHVLKEGGYFYATGY
ncbi:MAG TPA: ATP-binding cassette domain-containing protein [Methanoregulaceae archaeon]|nr:ATP-binding cassette domain-containing protein [Methanoregulaceae archaeon]